MMKMCAMRCVTEGRVSSRKEGRKEGRESLDKWMDRHRPSFKQNCTKH